MNQAIIEYNTYLVANHESRYNILDYINHINTLQKPIDLTFMSDLLELVDQDNWIPHTLLIKYGAFNENNASVHIKEALISNEMVNESDICIHNIETSECVECKDKADFKLSNVRELGNNEKHYNKKIYYLKPDTFKFILMRSKCEKKYAKYYILLEKAIKYYHDYQKMFDAKALMHKDTKIDELSKEIKEQTRLMKLQHLESQRKIDELLNINQEIKEDTSAILGISLEESEKKEVAKIQVVTASNISINVPIPSKQEYLIIFREHTGEFYYARGLFNYISGVCLKKCGKSLASIIKDNIITYKKDKSEYLKYYKYIPNARHLIQVVIENLVSDIIKTSANTIRFKTPVTNEYFMNKIQEIYDQRLTIDISPSDTTTAKSKAKETVCNYKPKSRITKNMIDTLQ